MKKSTAGIIIGFLAGAAAGAMAGILFAPDKGANTRKKLRGMAEGLSDELREKFEDFLDELDPGIIKEKPSRKKTGRKKPPVKRGRPASAKGPADQSSL